MENPFAAIGSAFRAVPGGPLGTASLLAAGVYGLGRLAWKPFVRTGKILVKPLATTIGGMDPKTYDEDSEAFMEDEENKKSVPRTAALLTGLGTLALLYTPGTGLKGMLNYGVRPGMPKKGSVNKTAGMSDALDFIQTIDYNKRINANAAKALFSQDPYMQYDPYSRNMGTAILSNACMESGTQRPTLGSVFDSAVDKIGKKLSFGGLVRTGVQATVANGLSRLFTGALDTMMNLTPAQREGIVNAGTWAGTINSILH